MPGIPFWWGQPTESETGRPLRIATQGLMDLPDPFLLGVATQGFVYDDGEEDSSHGDGGQIVSNPTLPPMWSPEPVRVDPAFPAMRVVMLAVGSGAVH